MLNEELESLISKVYSEASLIEAVQLDGGISSIVHRATIKQDGQTKQIIIRMIDDQQWMKEEPDIISHEKAALKQAENIPVATPAFIASDDTREPGHHPSLLMTNLPGNVILVPDNIKTWLDGLAKTLDAIHRTNITDFHWTYAPYQSIAELHVPSWTNMPDIWESLFNYMKRPMPAFEPVFIHRDYHPNNVLWKNGHVSGVVDWVNACMGPVGADVGHCRWNLAMLYGKEAADDFLDAYLQHAQTGWHHDVYWDLRSLLDVLEAPVEVYRGWEVLGVDWLTPDLMAQRMDDYARHLMEKASFQ